MVDVVKMAMDIFNEDYVSYNPLVEKLYGNLDKTQLIRIVTNLVKNSNQAVENKEDPRVVVRVFSQDESIVIEVEDNGKGIEKEVEELIFEPKFTTKSSGMGLGLPIIKNIIEAYNGTLSFRSQEGKGTIFTVTLPKS